MWWIIGAIALFLLFGGWKLVQWGYIILYYITGGAFSGLWRLFLLPLRPLEWIYDQIYWQWRLSPRPIFFAKVFVAAVALALTYKAVFVIFLTHK